MTALPPHHRWILTAEEPEPTGELPEPPRPDLEVGCHRRLRGPFTGGGSLLRRVVPELLARDPESVAARATEITVIAPDLAPLVPRTPRTLTQLADAKERTRFYPAPRALRIAHGVAELALDWARLLRPEGAVIAFYDVDEADPTDRELVAILLRRCDPARLTVVAESHGDRDDALTRALTTYTVRAARAPRPPSPRRAEADLAQLFIDSDGTSRDPAVRNAYAALPPAERARRHTARAEALRDLDDPTLRLGAIPYHLEHGDDPAGAGVAAFVEAVNSCFAAGLYEAVADLAARGRRLAADGGWSKAYRTFTHKAAACLCYLGRGHEAFAYLEEMRRATVDPDVHMGTAYLSAMLHTRFLPRQAHDEDLALAWVNTAIAFADSHPDPERRVLARAFMRNARALVELHRGDVDGSLALVEEAIALTDAGFGPDEQLLHRSVLLYNRAQVRAARKDHTASLRDYDDVIRRDPDYGDYYFERAAQYRALGRHDEALRDYATAIRLTPPFYEAHFNRADLLLELGDDEGALRDLDYALDLEPGHLDSLTHRAELLLERGDTAGARRDVEHGLAIEPRHAPLLAAQGALLEATGDPEAAYESYSAALVAEPAFVPAWANRAVLAYAGGRVEQAVADLDAALRIVDDATLRANRAVALQDLGEHRRALADLDVAVSALGADDPDVFYLRGVSRHALADARGALADWRAHLKAFGPGETSPRGAEIELRAGDLTLAQIREGVE
ncbi:tetratricopeptide repeat protein [Streptomyces sp. NPDC053474]|uniref:tetratricopeptide repeat protein n=1 Tax=Streptomyces sp. NPDC053474 TaxID=3365704 RepID=UPI0037D3E0A2